MKIVLAVCFLVAGAQATDIDWADVRPMDVIPESIAGFLNEERLRSKQSAEIGSRIVGGVAATPGQFPYQVGLISRNPNGNGFCGGSILNEEWILTAAHCVDHALSVEVIAGAQFVLQNEGTQIRAEAARIVIHRNWNPRTIKYDIALLKLDRSLRFSARIQPIRLPRRSQASNSFAGQTATVSGWGRDSDSSTAISPVLRWTSNPVITNLACNMRFFFNIDAAQICLDGAGGRSACNGDSGGPLVVTDTDGEITLIGVVSFGIALGCEIGWPGVFVRVTSYLDWIQTNTDGSVVVN